MSIMPCPTCGDPVYIGTTVKVGQLITCDSCEEVLRITSIQPVKLQIQADSFDLDPADDFIPVPPKPVPGKKEKKSNKTPLVISAIQSEMDDEAEEKKKDKKKRKQVQRQKIEFFDE